MSDVLEELSAVIGQRLRDMPEGSYTASLARKGKGYVARKVGEEAVEVVVASLAEGRERVVSETADLLYHLLVLLALEGISLDEVREELRRRMK
ncbi:Phosphoribosyl-ATP pyrophosphatase [Metallosphaera sp. J1]|uniref:phosphoribosyl-ATP diphosphatase n=1 Tax=Metallosphaera javensis (ex Hofmann et al. 2022) TaxID=99938 RepID=UPI001EDE9F2D|nr:phosphoribosyl-ATP diphosphatase [Metallosphaera javensis (ex Hofmann et al. 2022)]MCG3108672.1 Phosphoribosyl-ATP pyrophosphatase [Metallosphaera javensis (ex Hofmann et al. 2022)]